MQKKMAFLKYRLGKRHISQFLIDDQSSPNVQKAWYKCTTQTHKIQNKLLCIMAVGPDGDFIAFYSTNEKRSRHGEKNLSSHVCDHLFRSPLSMYVGHYYVTLTISLCKLVPKMEDFFWPITWLNPYPALIKASLMLCRVIIQPLIMIHH